MENARWIVTLEKGTWELGRFLSRWGLWNKARGYHVGPAKRMPGFALVFPHLLWERREQYRNALAGKPRAWLNKAAHLSIVAISEPPYFLVERLYCEEAIEATTQPLTIFPTSNLAFASWKIVGSCSNVKPVSGGSIAARSTLTLPTFANCAQVKRKRKPN